MLSTTCVRSYAYQKLCEVGFSEQSASRFAPKVQISSYEEGDVVWRRGAPVLGWSGIINGVVVASMPDTDKATVSIGLYGNDAWFGEYAILNNRPSYANYTCMVSTDIVSVPSATVHEVVNSDAKFAGAISRLVAWRAQRSSEMLVLMRICNPVIRSVMGLYLFSEALAYCDDRPPTLSAFESMTVPFKQAMIASFCGVSRTVMSDCLQKLAAQDWVKISYGQVELLYYATWQRFANKQRNQLTLSTNPDMDEILADLRSCDIF
jgi:CRP-like cAMP-binding protein